ncbi:hypothetical protein ACFE04_023756 [Oxalis oulophora]
MGGTGNCFVEWKEEFVSQERGRRVVHYFLKNSAAEFVLAVVGTERSLRHMFYVAEEDFLCANGVDSSMYSNFKWRSRREVVDWLTSMLAKQHAHEDRSSYEHDSMNASGSIYQGHLSKNSNGHKSDILWSGSAWTCGKRLKHYPTFIRNGTTIQIQSFVFVMCKGDSPYLAYLEDMYEDKRGLKKVKVRWFHHNQEVKGVIPLRNHHPKEVFITPHAQVISAECVDGPATILTREHFVKWQCAFPNSLLARVHMCSRQFRKNRVKPFDLTKLRGYLDQPILSCLSLDFEEDEELNRDEIVKFGFKRPRDGKLFVTDHSGAVRNSQMMAFGPPYRKRLLFMKQNESEPLYIPKHEIGGKVEVLCQDSGLTGCWFRCTVLQISRKHMKVRYDDIQDEEEFSNLEEWIPALKLAAPDKLGMRCLDRPTIRPAPPREQTDLNFELGMGVDAWWSDGWWEGIVAGVDTGSEKVQVYIPGENFCLNLQRKDVRISSDWVRDKWIYIEAKPHLLPSKSIIQDTQVSLSPNIATDALPDGFSNSDEEIPSGTKLDIIEDEKTSLVMLPNSEILPEQMDEISVCQDKANEVQSNAEVCKGDEREQVENGMDKIVKV